MAGAFFRRLLRRPIPDLPAAVAALALGERERCATAAFYEALYPLFTGSVPAAAASLTRAEARDKLGAGVPLLRGIPLAFDARGLAKRCSRLARALGRKVAFPVDATREFLDHVLAGNPQALHARAEAIGLDPGHTAAVLRLAAFPTLRRTAATLAPWRDGLPWPHGYCPACGAWPVLGTHRGLEQTRHLECGWCDSTWEFPRLACPFCAATDHRLLGNVFVEGTGERLWAATCDGCRGYVKTVGTLERFAGPDLLAADRATLHLDLVASGRGYLTPG